MLYDVITQNNHVFIGMEDVSVTYRNANKVENVSLDTAKEIIVNAASEFANSEDVQRMIGKKSYYPMEWDKPCRAIIMPHGAIDFSITNYRDLASAQLKGAVSISFSSNMTSNIEAIEKMETTFKTAAQ